MQTNINGIVITLTPEQVQDGIRKNLPVIERIKTYEDAVQEILNIDDNELRLKQAKTFKELSIIAYALREGKMFKEGDKMWFPQFNRIDTKFLVRFSTYRGWYSDANTDVMTCLAVFDEKTSNYFGRQFLPRWEIFTRE